MALECTGGEITLQEIITDVNLNTLKETNIAHPLVETAVPSGAVFTDTVKNKNIIVNGDFAVSQEHGTDDVVFGLDDWGYFSDMFLIGQEAGGQYTVSDSYMGYSKSKKFTVDTANTDFIGIKTWYPIYYYFEGQDLYSEQGKDITISFKFKASEVGIYTVSFGTDEDGYISEINVLQADTEEKYSITIPMLTSWTVALADDENQGMSLLIGQLNEGDFDTSLTDTWLMDTTYFVSSNNVNWAATAGNYIEIADIQVERGSVATEFEKVLYSEQLLRVQRYYWKLGVAWIMSHVYSITNMGRRMTVYLPVTMRKYPTVTATFTTHMCSQPTIASDKDAVRFEGVATADAGYFALDADSVYDTRLV